MTPSKSDKPVQPPESDPGSGSSEPGAGEADSHPEPQAAEPTAEAAAGAAPAPRRGGRGIAVFALLLALVALAGSGYLFYRTEVVQKLQQKDQTAAMDRQVDAINARLEAFEKQSSALQQRQQQLAQNLQEQIAKRLQQVAEKQQALTESLEKVYAQLNRNLDSWALEEVEQLLRIANQGLVLNRDVRSAIAALELADRRLREIGDPALLPVRQQIANDVAQLKSVPEVDTSGLALRLASTRSTIDKLPLINEPQRQLSRDDKSKNAEAARGWLASSRELLSDTIGLIRIQNISEPVRPLLTPEQRYFLLTNLKLMLSGAQLAALQTEPLTYRDNLQQAQQWLQQYFDTSDARVEKVIGELKSMEKIDLVPEIPSIRGSMAALESAKQENMKVE